MYSKIAIEIENWLKDRKQSVSINRQGAPRNQNQPAETQSLSKVDDTDTVTSDYSSHIAEGFPRKSGSVRKLAS